MKITVVYPGTFDPITNGHIDLARRATSIFDKVVIGVAATGGNAVLLDIDTRIKLARTTLADKKTIEVFGFNGLLVDFARQHHARAIIRGLRAVSDFDYEFRLAGMNRQLDSKLESIFLTPDEKYTFISSGLIREIALLGGDISGFVPPIVVKVVTERCKQLSAGKNNDGKK